VEHNMAENYQHFSESERETLFTLTQEGKSKIDIAYILARHKSTIYRELGRNHSSVGYLPDRAQRKYIGRRQKTSLLEQDGNIKNKVISLQLIAK